MENVLKQRLVGAVVIIAIAVIVIPMLLDGSGDQVISEIPPRPLPTQPDRGMLLDDIPAIPARPEVEASSAEIAPRQELQEQAQVQPGAGDAVGKEGQPEVTAAVETHPPVASTPASGPTQAAPQPEEADRTADAVVAWVVQIGSFSEQAKANALRDRMRTLGFKTFVEPYQSQQRLMYRVRIGPHLERKQAQQTLEQLQKQSEVKGYITHHP